MRKPGFTTRNDADSWVTWARSNADSSFWNVNLPAFLTIIPEPCGLTVDVGAGEGRLARALQARGHDMLMVDHSARLIEAATAMPGFKARGLIADARHLPLLAGAASLVVLFMVLDTVPEMVDVVSEA